MDVMILSGGYGIEGSCGVVVNEVQARLQKRECEPVSSEMTSRHRRSSVPQGVGNRMLLTIEGNASRSHALVLISPEYHGSMSSTMKLQLDWLSKNSSQVSLSH